MVDAGFDLFDEYHLYFLSASITLFICLVTTIFISLLILLLLIEKGLIVLPLLYFVLLAQRDNIHIHGIVKS